MAAHCRCGGVLSTPYCSICGGANPAFAAFPPADQAALQPITPVANPRALPAMQEPAPAPDYISPQATSPAASPPLAILQPPPGVAVPLPTLAKRYRLIAVSEVGKPCLVEISSGAVVIGKAPECNVRLNDSYASRRHAAFRLSPSGLIVEDLGSANGTLIRCRHETVLEDGDELIIGTTTLRVEEV
jgi:hypothetical protein